MTTPINAIVAMTPDRLIGIGNKLPWRIPEDMKHFKELTMGKAVIMGRKTWESIPEKYRPLEGRYNIIVSRSTPVVYQRVHRPEEGRWGVFTVSSIPQALAWADQLEFEPWIIGGTQLYTEALDLITDLHVTLVEREIDLKPSGVDEETVELHRFPSCPNSDVATWTRIGIKELAPKVSYHHFTRNNR